MHFNIQQWLDQYILKPSDRYQLVARLDGHKGPINCFVFNNNSSLLASRGDDEVVHVWDVNYFQTPTQRQTGCALAQAEACFWSIVILENHARVFSPGDSVESFCFDPVHHHLIVTSHFSQIKMYKVNAGMLVDLWIEEMNDAIPRTALFVDKGNGMIVYGLETGTGTCRDSQTAAKKFSRNLKSPIGNIGICPVYGNILVDNMTNGFDLYSLSCTAPLRSFVVPTTKRFTKKGVFGENRHIIVTGSDHGKVYVFIVNKMEPMQKIDHESEGVMIQSVETTTVSDHHLICSGSSDSPSSICIWEKPNAPAQQGIRDSLTVLMLFNVIMITLFWSASVWAPTLDVSMAATVSDFVQTQHTALFVADPKLPKLKLADMEADPLEAILNMDEETFRRLFNMPKLTEADLQRSEAEEMDEID
ncbi:WD40 repeat-like protein [Phlegmacium glaucopus]|nr:WD40 repeat-like protein [Phlegmacium glaucopus]